MNKLNLIPFVPKIKKETPKEKPRNGYESPIGWWNVYTEKDYDGSLRILGTYYGHVAEIALSVKENPFFEYVFVPVIGTQPPKEIPVYNAVRKGVNIGLDIDSGTWPSSMLANKRVQWFTDWFDTKDVVVSESNYYKSVFVEGNW